jgi:hypothetical protein
MMSKNQSEKRAFQLKNKKWAFTKVIIILAYIHTEKIITHPRNVSDVLNMELVWPATEDIESTGALSARPMDQVAHLLSGRHPQQAVSTSAAQRARE